MDDPNTFFLLSLNPTSGEKPWKITTKSSFPKGGGSDDEEDEKDPVFIKGALANTPEILEYILSTFLPDFKELITPKAKKIALWNNIVMEDIEIPEKDDPEFLQRVRSFRNLTPEDPDYEKVKPTFSEIRKLAQRRGKLVRKVDIDGTEHIKEYSFTTNS
jgi:hypothetical protein